MKVHAGHFLDTPITTVTQDNVKHYQASTKTCRLIFQYLVQTAVRFYTSLDASTENLDSTPIQINLAPIVSLGLAWVMTKVTLRRHHRALLPAAFSGAPLVYLHSK